MSHHVNVENITFAVRQPHEVSETEWLGIQKFEREVFAEAMADYRTTAEIDNFVQMNDPEGFIDSRIDPQVAVRAGRLNPGRFAKPVIVTAYDDAELAGYANVADNTSPPLAGPKMWTPPGLDIPKVGGKRYAWGREIVVHPDYQSRGIGQMMGILALETRHREQPVAVYTVDEMRMAVSLLHKLAFKETKDETPRYVFGEYSEPTYISRWAGPRVGPLIDRIIEKPGMSQARTEVNDTNGNPFPPKS